MGFVFQVKGCTLGIKSKHTMNVHIHPHSWCNGAENFGGVQLTTVTVMFRVTKIGKNTTQKNAHIQEESHYSLHLGTYAVSWTQTYIINHNTVSS